MSTLAVTLVRLRKKLNVLLQLALGLLLNCAVFNAAAATENNDTIATAIPVLKNGALGDNSFGAKDVDIYKFTGTPNQSVTVNVLAAPSGNVFVRLFDQTGAQLVTGIDGLQFTLPNTTTQYYVGISGMPNMKYDPHTAGSGVAGFTGSYTLGVQLRSPTKAELNDTLTTADVLSLSPNVLVTRQGQIGDGSFGSKDVDIYKFDGKAGQTVKIDIDAIFLGSGLDSIIRLFNSTGAEINCNDDVVGTRDSFLQALLISNDTYYIGVSGFPNGFSNRFTCVGGQANAASPLYNPATQNSGVVSNTTGTYSLNVELTPAAGLVDLAVTQTHTPTPVDFQKSKQLAYTITVVNNGPDPATNLVVTDTLSNIASVTFPINTTQGSCGFDNPVISCFLGSLSAGAKATITVNLQVLNGNNDATSVVSVAADQIDINPGNNNSTEAAKVIDLSPLFYNFCGDDPQSSSGSCTPAQMVEFGPMPALGPSRVQEFTVFGLRNESGYELNTSGPFSIVGTRKNAAGDLLVSIEFKPPPPAFSFNRYTQTNGLRITLSSGGSPMNRTVIAETELAFPPDPVINLTAVTPAANATSTMDLSWSPTGDDGTSGKVSNYEIRYATTQIDNEVKWGDAIRPRPENVTFTPTPFLDGEQLIPQRANVRGLSCGTVYYFALKATDKASNSSFSFPDSNAGNFNAKTTSPCPPSFDYSLTNSGNLTLNRGGAGFTGTVATLTAGSTSTFPVTASVTSTLPAGVSVFFTNNSCTPTLTGDRSCTITLTVSTSSSTPTGTFSVTVTGSPLSNKTTSINVNVISDTTPPVAGTVTPSVTAFGNFVGGSFNLSTTFTDAESAVTSCEYTVNGSTWLAATVSGISPNFTCTKTGITGTNGQTLTLNMRATSTGGTGTGTAITRTVDTAAPNTVDNAPLGWVGSDRTVTLTPSDGTGSGVASTQYCTDTSNSCTPSTTGTSVSVTCSAGSACQTYVRYRSTDNVDNVETIKSTLVKIDKVGPTASIVDGPTGISFLNNPTFTWTGTDNITPSGNLLYAFRLDPLEANFSAFGATTSKPYVNLAAGSYTFLVKAKDEAGNEQSIATSRAFTVSSGLGVTRFQQTPSGFEADFNKAIDPSVLNLYDTQTGGLGLADVTVIAQSTGLPVAGSLFVDAGATGITFVRTGGILPADTYKVTLRSDANGFRDTTGGLLDGDGNGTAGGDYMQTFQVTSPTEVVVSLPDFAVGPGQAVNLGFDQTGNRLLPGLPVTLSNGNGVRTVQFTLHYEPALLQFPVNPCQHAATLPASTTCDVDLSQQTLGSITVTLNFPTALAAGAVEILRLTASVPATATYKQLNLLTLENVSLSGNNAVAIPAIADDAIHLVAYLGDTTGNGSYSALDAQRVLRVVSGLDTGFAAYPLVDPVIVADTTWNGSLNSLDATRILQEAAGLDRQEIPAIP